MLNRYIRYLFSYIKCEYLNHINRRLKIERTRCLSKDTVFDCTDNSSITISAKLETTGNVFFQAHGGDIVIGERCYFNRNTIVTSRKRIEIGTHCLFGPNVCIYDHDHVFNDGVKVNEFTEKEVIIGDNCWIGAGAIILKGSIIGEGSIIGAGAVITGVIPPYSKVIAKHNNVTINLHGE